MGGRRRWPAGTLWLVLLLAQTVGVEAADIKVIASTGVASVVTELGGQFEAKTEHKVAADFAVIAMSKRKIDAGAAFDLAILGPAAIDELIGQGKIVPATRTSFGRTGLGVVIAKSAPKPDIATAEAFKRTMLAAKMVGHSKEGLSGVHFRAALDRLAITAETPRPRQFNLNTSLSKAFTASCVARVELGEYAAYGSFPTQLSPCGELIAIVRKQDDTRVPDMAAGAAGAGKSD